MRLLVLGFLFLFTWDVNASTSVMSRGGRYFIRNTGWKMTAVPHLFSSRRYHSETLMTFLHRRPAVSQRDSEPNIRLDHSSKFQDVLVEAFKQQGSRELAVRAARLFVKSPDFVGHPKELGIFEQLRKFSERINVLERTDSMKRQDVVSEIEGAFGQNIDALTRSGVLEKMASTLKDSLIAIKQLQEEHGRPLKELTDQLRYVECILKVGKSSDFPTTAEDFKMYRQRALELPSMINLSSIIEEDVRSKTEAEKEEEERKRQELKGNFDKYKRLQAALSEFSKLQAGSFHSTPQSKVAGFTPPVEFDTVELGRKEVASYFSRLGRTSVFSLFSSGKTAGETTTSPRLIPSSTDFVPLQEERMRFRLKPEVAASLSKEAQTVLGEHKIDPGRHSFSEMVNFLQREMVDKGRELARAVEGPAQHTFRRIGNTMVMVSTAQPVVWDNVPVFPELPPSLIPYTHATIAPAGVADLIVIRQQLVRYEGGEVAHIENVLRGEKKEREHTRRNQTQEIILREVETTTSEDRELESTNRFELSREVGNTIREDASLKAGLTVSGKYGPVVEFSATAEGSLSRSKEESTKSAAKFAQDVVQRSSRKVSEKVLTKKSMQIMNEVVERNSHTLDNTGQPVHVSGVYQWVNKVYKAQMYNYGLRVMYDFMIPEPATFITSVFEGVHSNAVHVEKPHPFTLQPDAINETNYHWWVHQYGADVLPPPEPYKTKSADLNKGGGDEKTDYQHSGQIALDDGYEAMYGSVNTGGFTYWKGRDPLIYIALGAKLGSLNKGRCDFGVELDRERGSIPFAISTYAVSGIALAMEITCRRTAQCFEKWQLETHAKIMEAYKAKMLAYEEKIAALEAQAGTTAVLGKNPQLNEEMMRDELKKWCVSVMTKQHFDLFGATENIGGVPQINFSRNEAQGAYVRFFEQAFEWEQMVWLTYPYFWGKKSGWKKSLARDDSDPLFNQFLKAGYCRVAVPARPSFESAIDHFMTYGETWNGGPLPAISSPLYLPIADEIAERLKRPQTEFPVGDPWEVVIPTSLVRLRPSDKLPAWNVNDEGRWVEGE